MYYTKYRPQRFADVQRPNEVADILMQQIKTGKTVHAYLFTGPRGTGKTTMARLLAKALNCKKLSKEGDVCGKCEYCLAVQNGSLIDLIEIDAASNRGIDDIRDLKDKVKLLPAEGKKKIYIIDEVHMLTNEAFNALLKTLEEPPKHAVFILCTTELHKVPETIRSRCQVFKFKRPTKSQLVDKLQMIAEVEAGAKKIAREEFERIAVMAGGAFRDAETILQQLIEGGKSVGEGTGEGYAQLLLSLIENRTEEALEVINQVYDEGIDLGVWTEGLLRYLRDILYIKMGFKDDYFAITEEALENRKGISMSVTGDWLVKAVEVFNQASLDLKAYSIPQLALEIAIVKMRSGDEPEEPAGKTPRIKSPEKGSDNHAHHKTVEKETEKSEKSAKTDKPEKIVKEVKQASSLKVDLVGSRWKEIITAVGKINNSVSALLKSGKPVGVEDNFIILEVSYKFHKERLESSANKKIVEKVLEDVFEDRVSIKCIVNQKVTPKAEGETGELTDMNVRVPPHGPDLRKKTTVVEVFDGGLPI